MDSTDTTGEIRVEVFVRSLRPQRWQGPQNRLLDRLEGLVERDVIDGFDVLVWGESAPASRADARTDFGRYVLDRVGDFRAWAEANGRSVEAVFDLRSVDSSITGETHRRLALPAMLMAEYHDGRLACVTPHERGGETVPLGDRVTELGIRPESAADLVTIEEASPREVVLPGGGAPDRPQSGRRPRNRDRTGPDRPVTNTATGSDLNAADEDSGLERRQ